MTIARINNLGRPKFEGVYTAIVTPFSPEEYVDEDSLEALIDFNIEGNVDGIVFCGTTGESPTLDHPEHDNVIELGVQLTKKRVPVIAGTGSNCTREAIRLTQHAEQVGADVSLQVVPYYNKPSQEGQYRHFRKIAEATKLPIIIYNIPGRTGVNMEPETFERLLRDCGNIVGLKESPPGKTDEERLKEMERYIRVAPQYQASVLSGDDGLALETIKLGGQGVISVASNIVPAMMSKMVNLALQGRYDEAKIINKKLSPLFKVLFVDTNPIPIKYALSRMGRCKEIYRLPLCEMSQAHKEEVDIVLRDMRLI